MPVTLLPPASPGDLDALAALLGMAFAFPPEQAAAWFNQAGTDNLRVLREPGDGAPLVGGLLFIPMGLHVGGRAVPMCGVAGVGVRADQRRRGLASAMMRAALHDMRSAGFAVSVLYASNQPLYRRVGYEQAGTRTLGTVDPFTLPPPIRGLHTRLAEGEDHAAVKALYDRVAPSFPGWLQRGDYCWARVLGPRHGLPAHTMLLEDERGRLQGYLCWRQAQGPTQDFHKLTVTDAVAATPQANRQLIGLLADLSTMVRSIELPTDPTDPLYAALPHPTMKLALHECWMLRVLDVRAALEARGYPPRLELDVPLEVVDEDLPDNAGRWVLRIRDGRGSVRRGGTGELTLHARGLAAAWTGHASPATLRLQGLAEGPEGAMRDLAAALAGPSPWMRDMF